MKYRLKTIYNDEFYSIKIFKPSIYSLFYGNLRRMNFHEKIRFFITLLSGYKIYYLFKGDEDIGYCVVSKGSNLRYPFATKKDIIIGPYFIKENHRGKKLSVFLINKIINDFEKKYIHVYDFIQKENIASIKVTEKCGFILLYEGNYTIFTRRLKPQKTGEGQFLIYQKQNDNM